MSPFPDGAGLKLMYDAVNPTNIPPNAPAVAGYIDGLYKWPDWAWDTWPKSYRITVSGDLAADICDCESGNLTPAGAVLWASRKLAAGGNPIIYASRSLIPTIIELSPQGEAYRLWVADWTGEQHLMPGAWGTQYDHDLPPGYDVSVILGGK